MEKRIRSFMLAVVMLFGVIPLSASAVYFDNDFDEDWVKEGINSFITCFSLLKIKLSY